MRHRRRTQEGKYRAQLFALLQDEELAALIAAAPTALLRPLRSLCRMLRLEPPPILARPKPAPPPAAPPAPAPAEPAAPPPGSPPPARATSKKRRRAPPRACGPPQPA